MPTTPNPTPFPAPLRPDLVAECWVPWLELSEEEQDRELTRLVDAGAYFHEIARWMGIPHDSGQVALRLRRARERAALRGWAQHRDDVRLAVGMPTDEPEEAPNRPSADEAPDGEPVDSAPSVAAPTRDDLAGPRMELMWVVLDANSTPRLATSDLDHAIAGLAGAWRTHLAREDSRR